MTRDEAKTRLERYTGLRLEVRIRLERLAELQQMDRERPSLCGSRSEEYARAIAPIVQANRREMAEIEAAVAALPDPLEREVLRLRYMDSNSIRPFTWKEIALYMYGRDGESQVRSLMYLHQKALSDISDNFN